jgi:hypothetical protein
MSVFADAMAVVPTLLLLAVVDGAFAGFRAGAGRTGLVRPWRRGYYPRFVVAGALAAVVCQVPAAIVGVCVVDTSSATELGSVVAAASALLWVAAPYAAVVLLALLLWLVAGVEGRTLASVTVLGPFTLVRPFVVLAGLGQLIVVSPFEIAITFSLGCAGVLLVEPLVGAKRSMAIVRVDAGAQR